MCIDRILLRFSTASERFPVVNLSQTVICSLFLSKHLKSFYAELNISLFLVDKKKSLL